MKSLVVSVVDVLGIFVPGFLLLIGILLLPVALGYSSLYKIAWQATPESMRTNLVGIGIIVVTLSYVMGFVIRMCAILILQELTKKWWGRMLTQKANALTPILESCLDYPDLCTALKESFGTSTMGHLTQYAPYFSFAKRIIRNANAALWADAERLEAELRFSAGLFIPFCLLSIDGLFLIGHQPFGWILLATSLIGGSITLVTFPRRRMREVLHVYTMAIITLRYKPVGQPAKAEDKAAEAAGLF
jgi:hypothetical protein